MVLPVAAIEASLDIPHLVEIKPGKTSVRIVYRATLRNTGEETRVLHAPTSDHTHFWHLFDDDLNELDRERGAGKGGEKETPNPRRFRSLTLGPGEEVHQTKTIRIDPETLLSGPNRWVLRVDLWGQSAEAEFHTVVRPARVTAAKKRPAVKRKTEPARKKTTRAKKSPTRKRAAKKATARRKPARKKVAKKKPAARKKAATARKAAKKTPDRKRAAKRK